MIRIGGIAKMVSAMTAGFTPVPIKGINRTRMARLGMIRKVPHMPVDSIANQWNRALMIPSGIPTIMASSTARTLTSICSIT